MADPNGISTNVKVGGEFKTVSRVPPVTSFQVKPDIIPVIIEKLSSLQGRTDDSEIVQSGRKYSFMDKRNGQPLAELDSAAGQLTMYKSPKDMAARIDSAWISEEKIKTFIAESKVDASASASPAGVQNTTQLAAAR